MVDGKIPGKTAYGRVKNAQHWLGVEVINSYKVTRMEVNSEVYTL